jgi:peroxiredoxin
MRNMGNPKDFYRMFAITIDSADKNIDVVKKIEADGKGKVTFDFLSDTNSKTIESYGLRDERYDGKTFDGIPRPTIVIIDKKRKIHWIKIEDDYRKRPKVEDVQVEILNLLMMKK